MISTSALSTTHAANDSGHLSALEHLLAQLESVLLGKTAQIELAVCCLLARGHLLVEDRPGVGKTTLAQALGRSLGLEWKRVQFTNDLLPSDITGVSVFVQQDSSFVFKPGPVFTPVLLADEINRAPARAQSALLEAMEERQVTVDGQTHTLDPRFFVIATQNPADRAGAYPLPESQLDRFLVSIELGYPSADVEKSLLGGSNKRDQLAALEAVCDHETLEIWQQQVMQVHASSTLVDYVHALLQASRTREETHKDCRGLSPRAGINLLNMARATAFRHGRDRVLPDDVQRVFHAVAGHRLKGSVRAGYDLAEELLQQVALNPVHVSLT